MAFTASPLPYPKDALEPHMSTRTLEFHYGKHYQGYVTTLNALTKDTALADIPIEAVIRATAKDEQKAAIFNNAAQTWNHTFFWKCMRPKGGGRPAGDLLQAIETSFGSFDRFKEEFKAGCVAQFGSGWGWLVRDGNALKISKTPNAINPLSQGGTALLGCDVWEHAYYLDFQNRRADFVQAFLDHLVDWEFVASQLRQ